MSEYDKGKFAELTAQAMGDRTPFRFSRLLNIQAEYLEGFLKGQAPRPPKIGVLSRIAKESEGRVDVKELIDAAGYTESGELPPVQKLSEAIGKWEVIDELRVNAAAFQEYLRCMIGEMSWMEFAEKSGFSPYQLNCWLSKESRRLPSREEALALCAASNAELDFDDCMNCVGYPNLDSDGAGKFKPVSVTFPEELKKSMDESMKMAGLMEPEKKNKGEAETAVPGVECAGGRNMSRRKKKKKKGTSVAKNISGMSAREPALTAAAVMEEDTDTGINAAVAEDFDEKKDSFADGTKQDVTVTAPATIPANAAAMENAENPGEAVCVGMEAPENAADKGTAVSNADVTLMKAFAEVAVIRNIKSGDREFTVVPAENEDEFRFRAKNGEESVYDLGLFPGYCCTIQDILISYGKAAVADAAGGYYIVLAQDAAEASALFDKTRAPGLKVEVTLMYVNGSAVACVKKISG